MYRELPGQRERKREQVFSFFLFRRSLQLHKMIRSGEFWSESESGALKFLLRFASIVVDFGICLRAKETKVQGEVVRARPEPKRTCVV